MATKTKKNPKLVIPFTEDDLDQLMKGETFKWTFATNEGQDIDVLLSLESDVEDDEEPEDEGIAESDAF